MVRQLTAVTNFNDQFQQTYQAEASARRVTLVNDSGTNISSTTNGSTSLNVVPAGHADDNNSTDNPLTANSTYTGTATEILNFAGISLFIYSDVGSATEGLIIEYSDDTINWYEGEKYTYTGGVNKWFTPPVQSRYYRIKYVNGATNQTELHLHTTLKGTPIKWSSHNINEPIVDEDDAELTKSVITGKRADGTYDNVSLTNGSNMKVSLEELESGISVNNNSQLKTTEYTTIGEPLYDSSAVDAFGRLRMSVPETIFDSKNVFNDLDLADNVENQQITFDNQETTGTGTSTTYDVNEASQTISVGATTSGTRVRQTYMRFNYQPGKSQLIFNTFNVHGSNNGITKRIGYYDENNGLFLQSKDGVYSFVRRTNVTSTPVDNVVNQTNWNLDRMDGTGRSGITIDFTKTQILVIDFEWLGVGRVRMGWVINGLIYYAHEFLNANVLDKVYMSTPNLPVRAEINNDGTGVADNLTMICCSIMSEGGTTDLGSVRYASTEGTHIDANTENTVYALLGIRLKSNYIGTTVKILNATIQLQSASDKVEWMLIGRPTVAGTFTYVDESLSAVQIARGATANTVTGGIKWGGGFVESGGVQSGAGGGISAQIENAIVLGSSISGVVDEVVLAIRPIAGSTNVDAEASLTWRELL